jgi:hypothetical protein
VNTSSQRSYSGDLVLKDADAQTAWEDLVSGGIQKSSDSRLWLKIPPGGLRVLRRVSPGSQAQN